MHYFFKEHLVYKYGVINGNLILASNWYFDEFLFYSFKTVYCHL